MDRPLSDKRPVGPFVSQENIMGMPVGESPADAFDEMFDSFTIVLEYNIVSDTLMSDEDIEKEAHELAEVLNNYLFKDSEILYFMMAEKGKGKVNDYTISFGIDGDVWEGRLDREGKYEGSIAGTEDMVNAHIGAGRAVDSSYMHIYPTKVAREIQETGSY